MSLLKHPFITLRQCFQANSCRYTKGINANNANRATVSERFLHRAYSSIILQYAAPATSASWFNRRNVESTDNHMRISSRKYATAAKMIEPGTALTQTAVTAAPNPAKLPLDEEIELLDESEARIFITERAALKLSNISTMGNDPDLSLRIAVESGGCHGYQYKLELTSEQAPDDYRFIHPKHQTASILVDAVSLGLLKGSTLDYATELIGSSFRIIDNPQAKSAGCGCGISWEAKF